MVACEARYTIMYHPRYSIYCRLPKRRWHRNALDWWVYCYGGIPVSENARIRGRVSAGYNKKTKILNWENIGNGYNYRGRFRKYHCYKIF